MSASLPRKKLLTAKDVFDAIYQTDESSGDDDRERNHPDDIILSEVISSFDVPVLEGPLFDELITCTPPPDLEFDASLTVADVGVDEQPKSQITNDSSPGKPKTNDQGLQDVTDINTSKTEQGQKYTKNVKKSRKLKRACGEEYISSRGKLIQSRVIGSLCGCKNDYCMDKNLSLEERNAIFSGYYALADRNLQRTYLFGQIVRKGIKRRYAGETPSKRNRDHSFEYTIKRKNEEQARVCKTAFANIHGIKFGLINGICDQMKKSVTPLTDTRGKHPTRPNKVTDEQRKLMKEHIESFPKHVSHYSRKENPDKVYMSPDMDVSKLHKLYKTWCEENGVIPIKYRVYHNIFNSDFNIGFGAPRSDTCKVCDQFNASAPAGSKPIPEWELHLRQADAGYKNLKADTERNTDDETVIAFDLQQALPSPVLPTGIIFYLRQLWTYNFCVHNCKDNTASMYLWSEDIAARGATEITSCLMKYLESVSANVVIAYSDNCAGQNKNFAMVSMLWLLVANGKFKRIDHKFLVTGHTFLPCDRDFGLIEKVKRKREYIFLPSDWIEIIRSARTTHPFNTVLMNQPDFLQIELANIVNRKVTTDGEKVRFSEIRWFRYDKAENEYGYSFKYTYSDLEDWKHVNLTRRGREINVKKLPKYIEPRKINPKKVADLMKIIPLLPESVRPFYRNLKGGEDQGVEVIDDINNND